MCMVQDRNRDPVEDAGSAGREPSPSGLMDVFLQEQERLRRIGPPWGWIVPK